MDTTLIAKSVLQLSLLMFVASFGMRARWRAVFAGLHDVGTLLRAFVAVNIIVPAAALIACNLLPIDRETAIGIIIMAVSPLAPIVGAKMLKAGYDASRTVALYFWLVAVTIIVVPASVWLLGAIYPSGATVPAIAVAKLVLFSVILPLSAGLTFNEFFPAAARRLAPLMLMVAAVMLLVVFALITYLVGGEALALIGNGSLLAIVATVAAGLAAGHALGGQAPEEREGLALAAATRHPGIALLIASHNFTQRRVLMAIMLFLLTSVVVSIAYEQWLKRRRDTVSDSAIST